MADSNDEALLPAPLSKRRRGRPKKERPKQPLCRAKGRFVRCPELGPRPAALRAHRRVCAVDAPFTCPRGSKLVENPPGPKGEHRMGGGKGGNQRACLFVPPPDSKLPARFVPPTCSRRSSSAKLREPGIFSPEPPKASSPRVRGPKVRDWSKCRCAPGLKSFKLASGALKCRDPETSKFVRASCDESAYQPVAKGASASRSESPAPEVPAPSRKRPKPTAAQRPMPSKFKRPRSP